MPALDFPNSPVSGQIFASGSVTWQYNGTRWFIVSPDNNSLQTDRPSFSLTRSTGQVITTAVATTVLWDVEEFDNANLHSLVTNTDRVTITPATSGLWHIGYTMSWADTANGGYRNANMRRNASLALGLSSPAKDPGNFAQGEGTALIRLVAGDYIDVAVYHTAGIDLSIRGNASNGHISQFYGFRLGN